MTTVVARASLLFPQTRQKFIHLSETAVTSDLFEEENQWYPLEI